MYVPYQYQVPKAQGTNYNYNQNYYLSSGACAWCFLLLGFLLLIIAYCYCGAGCRLPPGLPPWLLCVCAGCHPEQKGTGSSSALRSEQKNLLELEAGSRRSLTADQVVRLPFLPEACRC